MTVLVAGCGYVGRELAARLRDDGREVLVLSRSGEGRPEGTAHVSADLTEPASLSALPPGIEIAYFTAAPDSRDEEAYRALYVEGLSNLRARLEPHVRVVFTSSTAVYGHNDGSRVDESSETTTEGFRGPLLLEAEAAADVSVRLAGIYGPGRARALDSLRRGDASFSPRRFSNLVHRDDAAAILKHLAELPEPDPVYIGCDDEPVQSEELYRWLAHKLGCEMPPAGPDRGRGKRCSNRRLRGSGYRPLFPTFREGYGALLPRGVSP